MPFFRMHRGQDSLRRSNEGDGLALAAQNPLVIVGSEDAVRAKTNNASHGHVLSSPVCAETWVES